MTSHDHRPEACADVNDLVRMLVASSLEPVLGGDEKDHELVYETDGDGWNEPEIDQYSCICDGWAVEWTQRDPERSGRLDPVDAALAWREHVLTTFPKDDEDELRANCLVGSAGLLDGSDLR